jgi:hypothetical protein
MLIVLSIYAALIWILFFKAKLLPWSRGWKWTVYTVGLLIALVVLGALNFYTPSGRVVVQGATVEIIPNVSGTVVAVEAAPNVPLKQGDVIFRIDPVPFAAEVRRLEAALTDARENVGRMEADLDSARADAAALDAQIVFARQRVADIEQLQSRGASTEFKRQEAVTQLDILIAQHASAVARARPRDFTWRDGRRRAHDGCADRGTTHPRALGSGADDGAKPVGRHGHGFDSARGNPRDYPAFRHRIHPARGSRTDRRISPGGNEPNPGRHACKYRLRR